MHILVPFGRQIGVLGFKGVRGLLLDMGGKVCKLPIMTLVSRYKVFGPGNEGAMSGTTIDQHERSQIIRCRLFIKFFVTPIVFYMCWRTSTYAVALGPEEMNGLGWRCLSSLTAAGVAASITVGFLSKRIVNGGATSRFET